MIAHPPIRFWIAADLLTQARAHGVALPGDFRAHMEETVRAEHCRALVEDREEQLAAARERARRARWRAGGWRF